MTSEEAKSAGNSAVSTPPVFIPTVERETDTVPPRYTPSTPSFGLLRAFRRRWLLASILGLLAGGLAGMLLFFGLPQQYSGEVRLRVAAPRSVQADLIQSSTTLATVLRRPEVAKLPSVRQQRDPLAWLGDHLTVELSPISDIVLLRVTSTWSDEAALLVQTIAEVYRHEAAARREASLRKLKETHRRMEEGLRKKRERLARLENTRQDAAEKECQRARFDLRVARAKLAAEEQRRAGAERGSVSDQAVEAHLKEDPTGRRLLLELDAAEEQIKRLIRISVPKERDLHLPEFNRQRDEVRKKLEARRAEIRSLVEQRELARALEEYQARLAHRRERVVFYEGLVGALEDEVRALGGAGAAEEVKTLREEISAASEALRQLAAEIARDESAAVYTETNNGLKETLTVQQKNPERRWQLAGLGGVGCGALVALVVAGRERRLRRIVSRSDVTTGLGLPVVGNIPSSRHVLTLEDLDSEGRINEAVDALRTVLLHDSGSGPHLFLVTSAIGGEGKSTLAAQLAASLARAWRKTLLLDADLRKPEVHTLFQAPLEPGLSEVLRGEAEAAEAIQPTSLSRLWMMPAGHGDAHAIQALAQHGAGRLFDSLKEQFDIIVLDACPVLPLADVLLLSSHVASVVLAVRSGVSRLPIVQAAAQRLASVGAPLHGAVLLGPDGDLDGRVAV